MNLETRICSACGIEKLLIDFGKDSARKDQIAVACKPCANSRLREQYRDKYAQILLYRVKANAKANCVPFDLDHGDLVVPTHCPALGVELAIGEGRGGLDNSPSVDRIKPHLGYVKGNVVVVSKLANTIKAKATADQILAVGNWLKKLEASHG